MTRLCGLLGRLATERRGSTTLLFALMAPFLIGMAALATDVGELYLRKRTLQAAVDAAALAAATHPDIAATVARKALNAAGQTNAVLSVEFGAYDETAPDRSARFVPSQAGNAVRVEARLKSPPRLARIFTTEDFEITAEAEAALVPVVSMSIGSRLASVDSGLVGSLLSSVLGLLFDLSGSDYAAMSRSTIELGALLRAVAPNGGTVKQAVQTSIRVSDLFTLLSVEMRRKGDLPAMAVLRKAASRSTKSNAVFQLSRILRLDDALLRVRTDYPALATQADLSVLDLFNAAMRQFGTGGSLEASIVLPGIGSAEIGLQIGEAGLGTHAVAVSENYPSVETDTVRLRVRVTTSGLLDLLQTKLDLPIELVAGGGSARVTNVRCSSDPADRKVTVRVRPGLIKLALGTWTTPLASASIDQKLPPVEILSLLGTGVEAQAFVLAGSIDPIDVSFSASEIANATVKTVRTKTVLQSLVGTLLAQTSYTVRGLPIAGLVPKIGAVVAPLAAPLDQLLNSLLSVAGVGLGEVDVRMDSLICKQSRIIG